MAYNHTPLIPKNSYLDFIQNRNNEQGTRKFYQNIFLCRGPRYLILSQTHTWHCILDESNANL